MKWIKKKTTAGYAARTSDVKITLVGLGGGKRQYPSTCISILSPERFFEMQTVMVGTENGRMYFKPDVNGHTLSIRSDSRVGVLRTVEILQLFVGEYPMKYDQELKMYYIDRKDRVN